MSNRLGTGAQSRRRVPLRRRATVLRAATLEHDLAAAAFGASH